MGNKGASASEAVLTLVVEPASVLLLCHFSDFYARPPGKAPLGNVVKKRLHKVEKMIHGLSVESDISSKMNYNMVKSQ